MIGDKEVKVCETKLAQDCQEPVVAKPEVQGSREPPGATPTPEDDAEQGSELEESGQAWSQKDWRRARTTHQELLTRPPLGITLLEAGRGWGTAMEAPALGITSLGALDKETGWDLDSEQVLNKLDGIIRDEEPEVLDIRAGPDQGRLAERAEGWARMQQEKGRWYVLSVPRRSDDERLTDLVAGHFVERRVVRTNLPALKELKGDICQV